MTGSTVDISPSDEVQVDLSVRYLGWTGIKDNGELRAWRGTLHDLVNNTHELQCEFAPASRVTFRIDSLPTTAIQLKPWTEQ